MGHDLSRRTVLKQGLFATVALAAKPLSLRESSGMSGTPATAPQAGDPRKRVLVVGAGLAGLAAAYGLTQAGHDCALK